MNKFLFILPSLIISDIYLYALVPRSNRTARKRPVPWIYGDFVDAVFRPEFFGFFRCLPAVSDRKRLEFAGFFPRYSAHNRVLGTGTETAGSGPIFHRFLR